jgi:hypothetical protein
MTSSTRWLLDWQIGDFGTTQHFDHGGRALPPHFWFLPPAGTYGR